MPLLRAKPDDLKKATLLYYEIKDEALDASVKHVLNSIPDEYEDEFPSSSIREGSVEVACVTEDYIMLDRDKLAQFGNQEATIGTTPHELAHAFLRYDE